MYNIFKKILPLLKHRFFGSTVPTIQPVSEPVFCLDLYVVDNHQKIMNICNINENLFIVDSLLAPMYINDYEIDLYVVDLVLWEINDGCS